MPIEMYTCPTDILSGRRVVMPLGMQAGVMYDVLDVSKVSQGLSIEDDSGERAWSINI
jgi:hypothetical protein